MEDENGLELSLGLSCGGSAGKSRGNDGCSSNSKTEEGTSNNKSIGDLKIFLNAATEKQESGSQEKDPVLTASQSSQANFFTILAKSSQEADASADLHRNRVPYLTPYGGLWDANNGKSCEEEKSEPRESRENMWLEASNKRKMLIEEINHQKKQERETQRADQRDKSPSMGVSTSMRTSHISINTEDGSTAENEDVAESEAEGSSSRLVSHFEDGSKRYKAIGASFETSKESHRFTNSSVKANQGQKHSNAPVGNVSKHGDLNFGIPMSFQPGMNVPFSISGKVPSSHGDSTSSGFPLTIQMIRPGNNEQSGAQQITPGSVPAAFGYSPVHLPVLDTGHSWPVGSLPQHYPPSYASRSSGNVTHNSDKSEDSLKISQVNAAVQAHQPQKFSEALPESELATSSANRPVREEGRVESLRREGLAIRQGLAPGLTFGGCGSHPDLPWVSTTGPGPDGRTISGVTYMYDQNQTRIVCACHGSHMSPEEFVLHASVDPPNPESNPVIIESTGRTSSPA